MKVGKIIVPAIFLVVLLSIVFIIITTTSFISSKKKGGGGGSAAAGGGSAAAGGGSSMVVSGNILRECQPSSYSPDDDDDISDKIEALLKKFIELLGPAIILYAVERLYAKALTQIDKIRILRKELKKSKSLVKQLAVRRTSILMKTNSKYRIAKMLRFIKPIHLAKLGTNVAKYLRVLASKDPQVYQAVIREAIEITARRTGQQISEETLTTAARESARRIATRFATSIAARSAMGPVGYGSLIVGIVGMALDIVNYNSLQDITRLKTSDFLAYREAGINELKDLNLQAYIDAYSTTPPSDYNINFSIVGPFLKYEVDDFDAICLDIEIRLMLLSGGPTYEESEQRIIDALGGENSPQIQKLREIQNKIFMDYYLRVQCLPPKPVCSFEDAPDAPLGTFSETGNFDSKITGQNRLIIYEYSKTPKDFAPGASFMFVNPGIPENKNFYIQFNGTYTAFITGFISCSVNSPVIFGGYFVDNQGNEADVPEDLGAITTLRIGKFSPARPACSSPLPVPSPIPTGCLFKLFQTSILSQLTIRDQDEIHKIALEYLCKSEGGKFIATTGECSYADAASCHRSYQWPPPEEDEEENPNVSTMIPSGFGSTGAISSMITIYNDTYITKNDGGTVYKLETSTIVPYIQTNIQSPVSMAIKKDKEELYVAGGSSITRIKNFTCSFTREITNNWITFSTGAPIVSISILGMYMYVLLQDRITRITIISSRLVDPWASSSTDAYVNFNVNQPYYMTISEGDMFIAKGNQISKITNVISAYDSENVTDNWISNNSGATILVEEPINPRSILVIGDKADNNSGEIFIGTNNNKIIKISNCFSPQYEIDKEWALTPETPSSPSSPSSPIIRPEKNYINQSQGLVNIFTRQNKSLLLGNVTSIVTIQNALSWDTENFGDAPPNPSDYTYAEWRSDQHFNLLYRDLGMDLTNDVTARGGVCVQWDPSHRLMCNSVTKTIPNTRHVGTNSYNIFTGECMNDESFCNAYGYDFDSRRSTALMANRGSGPLPCCYQSDVDKFFAFFLGSTIVQKAKMFFQPTPAQRAFYINDFLTRFGMIPSQNSNAPQPNPYTQGTSSQYLISQLSQGIQAASQTTPEDRRTSCGQCDPWTYYQAQVDRCVHKDAAAKNLIIFPSHTCDSGWNNNGAGLCQKWGGINRTLLLASEPTRTRCPSGYRKERDDGLCHAEITDVTGPCNGRNPRSYYLTDGF